MKLRILDNTLRLRLSRPEIDRLIAGQSVEASIAFPGSGALHFGLYPAAVTAINASFDVQTIVVNVPFETARRFAADDVTTLAADIDDDSQSLQIKIEKDFQCLAPRDEDESCLFTHPGHDRQCAP